MGYSYRIPVNFGLRRAPILATMPPRGAGKDWARLPNPPAESMSAAKATIRCMDLGSAGLWKWAPSPGNGVTSAVMQCNAHVLCGVLVRAVRTSSGMYAFKTCGAHSQETNSKRRQNSALTLAQEEVAIGAFRGLGSKPAEVRVELTRRAEEQLAKQGVDPLSKKDKEGGLAGAVPSRILALRISPSVLCIPSLVSMYLSRMYPCIVNIFPTPRNTHVLLRISGVFTVLSHLLGTDWCELARRFLN